MNVRDAKFLSFTGKLLASKHDQQVDAVADAIGCPAWNNGACDRDGECFCSTGAKRVAEIERGAA